jgi:hypothetical protein
MSTVEERLVIFAICFLISVPVSYCLLKNCVDINSRIAIGYSQDNEIINRQKIESKNENENEETKIANV